MIPGAKGAEPVKGRCTRATQPHATKAQTINHFIAVIAGATKGNEYCHMQRSEKAPIALSNVAFNINLALMTAICIALWLPLPVAYCPAKMCGRSVRSP
ncbi:hypothetical protein K504DRAFT_250996 [Pleomassaria siparia CBS 279.74]|uniref:Uncharacterized protein n=1 Tax=Pleomassaria siparia CBS 279.74 TaxID=1314801 RepID=A0A6G1KCJ6_9PLEO|nr:hypothetical protein K504DRAFT_250996 [Pleomassaria siparia CBS 279.74]